jgi:hypothetical protein
LLLFYPDADGDQQIVVKAHKWFIAETFDLPYC